MLILIQGCILLDRPNGKIVKRVEDNSKRIVGNVGL